MQMRWTRRRSDDSHKDDDLLDQDEDHDEEPLDEEDLDEEEDFDLPKKDLLIVPDDLSLFDLLHWILLLPRSELKDDKDKKTQEPELLGHIHHFRIE